MAGATGLLHNWHDFYLTLGGASAVLLGLVFVGVSAHLSLIARERQLRSLARQTFSTLLSAFLVSLFALIPSQARHWFGIELLRPAACSPDASRRPPTVRSRPRRRVVRAARPGAR